MRKTSKSSLREQAEIVLSSKPKRKSTNGRSQEHIIHELQIHQIELEIQNEELRRTQARLEEVSAKYFDLYQSAPSGYFIFDEDWMILEMNLTGAHMLGTAQQKNFNLPFHDFIHPQFQDSFYLHRRKVSQSGYLETCELKLKNNKYVCLESIAVSNQKGEKTGKIRSVFSDITEKKIIEEAFIGELELKVAERTKELQAANKSLGKEIAVRKMAEEGLQKAKSVLEDKVRERTALLSETNKSLLAEIEERKRTAKRLRAAQKNLRTMASDIILAEERSRRQFAADLHDTVVQTLGAAKMRSELLREHLSKEGFQYFTEVRNMLSQSITQTRLIITSMSPPVLYELGLIPSIEWLIEQIEYQHNVAIKLNANDGFEPLRRDIQVLLFHVVRELLANVVKHAKEGQIKISITGNRQNVRITVYDGKGFDDKIASLKDGHDDHGLFYIRERLRPFGGQLFIKSKPGRGAQVSMSVPTDLGKRRT